MDKVAIGSLAVIVICIGLTQGIAFAVGESRNYIINYLAIYTIGINWIFFLHGSGILFGNERTEKFYDLMGSVTFVSSLIITLVFTKKHNLRVIILAVLVVLWTVRLGAFLFTRIHHNKGIDSRFTEIKANHFRFLMTWTLQGVWAFMCLLPIFILSQKIDIKNRIEVLDYVGIALWIIGFLIETIADYQKFQFKLDPNNRDNFINTGLWYYSRHPNYFGEILLWIGFSLIGFSGSRNYGSFITPVFVALLLIFVSGIPLLEKKADEKFADSEDYHNYKKSTPVLVPFIGRAGDAMF